ncbi:hypothetical protein [Streptomyces sp. MMBL 11-3]|uniref:hypothetical protein n=1 Tax=Streptomyces sp. MMBL 11-3 TaxID=3382639 RepID=UPI0039B54F5F
MSDLGRTPMPSRFAAAYVSGGVGVTGSGAHGVGFTPTSTDPGVATAFARHSEQYGEAVVQVIPRSAFDGVVMERGYTAAEAAGDVLGNMGIHVPKVNMYEGISDALQWDIPKPSPEQIAQFVAEAYKYG